MQKMKLEDTLLGFVLLLKLMLKYVAVVFALVGMPYTTLG